MTNNKFIQDCLAELANSEEARGRFNKVSTLFCKYYSNKDYLYFEEYIEQVKNDFEESSKLWRKEVTQTLLSITPDGQAVMPFLDVETKSYKIIIEEYNYRRSIQKQSRDRTIYSCSGLPNGHWMDSPQNQTQVCVLSERIKHTPKTLRQLLLQEFTRVCFDEGQGFEKALEIINSIYLQNV